MIIYKDIISGDEVMSSAFDPQIVDDIVYEINCKSITIKQGADVDIGANASAEAEDEALEDGQENVIDVVYSQRLQSTSFDKKGYLTYLKGYMKAVKAKLAEDEVAAFEKGAQAFAKKIVANFKDYEFYTGESMDPDGIVLLLNYREDGVTPYLTVWKHGVKGEKV